MMRGAALFWVTMCWLITALSSTAFAVPLDQRQLEKSGNGKMVPVQTYFDKAVEQVGGNVTIDYGPHSEYRTLQVPLNFYRGQTVGEVARNFCLMHKPFTYYIIKDRLYILPKRNWDEDIASWQDTYTRYHGYNRGSLFFTPMFGYSVSKPSPILGELNQELESLSRHGLRSLRFLDFGGLVEYMLTDNLMLSLSIISFSYRATVMDGGESLEEWGDIFIVSPSMGYMHTFTERISGSAGAGLAVVSAGSDKDSFSNFEWEYRNGRKLEDSLQGALHVGAKFRMLRSMHLSLNYILLLPSGFNSVHLGLSTKLFPW